MNIIYFLLPIALLMGGGFALSFVIAASGGQYDDLETPAHRLLLEDEIEKTLSNEITKERTESKTVEV